MAKKTEREKQTTKFLKWIDEHSGWWYLICTPKDEHINLSITKTIIENLAEKSLHEIIFVFLMVHREEKFMKNLWSTLVIKEGINKWDKEYGDELTTMLIEYFE